MYVRGAYAEDRKTGNPQKSVLRERGSASCGMNTCNPRLQDCWGGFSNDTGCSRWWRVRNVRLLYLYSMAVRCLEYHQHGWISWSRVGKYMHLELRRCPRLLRLIPPNKHALPVQCKLVTNLAACTPRTSRVAKPF